MDQLTDALRESEAALRDSDAWLAGQKAAFEAAVTGAPLEDSLGLLVRTAVAQWGGSTRCAFYIVNPECTELHHVTGMSASYAECVDGFKVSADSLACGLAVYTNRPVITVDVTTEPLWQNWLWLADRYRFRGCWSFPIETTANKVVGTFATYFESAREATARDLALAGILTRAAAIIISRHQEAQERNHATASLLASEASLRRALDEREVLLKELHHRVKNNLQVIMGLLEIQTETTGHPEALASLAEARHRVGAIASMHELLYQSDSFSQVDLSAYARRLATHVVSFYEMDSRVAVSVLGNGIALDLARAVPLGLVINELVLNACKHAFPGSAEGKLEIRLNQHDGHIVVQVKDTGIGIRTGVDRSTPSTFGLQLVQMLAKQLGGAVTYTCEAGTTVDVLVPARPAAA